MIRFSFFILLLIFVSCREKQRKEPLTGSVYYTENVYTKDHKIIVTKDLYRNLTNLTIIDNKNSKYTSIKVDTTGNIYSIAFTPSINDTLRGVNYVFSSDTVLRKVRFAIPLDK